MISSPHQPALDSNLPKSSGFLPTPQPLAHTPAPGEGRRAAHHLPLGPALPSSPPRHTPGARRAAAPRVNPLSPSRPPPRPGRPPSAPASRRTAARPRRLPAPPARYARPRLPRGLVEPPLLPGGRRRRRARQARPPRSAASPRPLPPPCPLLSGYPHTHRTRRAFTFFYFFK